MSLPETVSFDNTGKVIEASPWGKFFLSLVIILISWLSFGIGRLSVENKREPIKIIDNQEKDIVQKTNSTNQSASAMNAVSGILDTVETEEVYASSKGTRYYYLHCKSTVSDKNKVTFATASMAESEGYTLATNCKPR